MRNFNLKKTKGFTILELLLVIAVIGILGAVLAPYYSNYVKRGATARGIVTFSDAATKATRGLVSASGTTANVGTSPLVSAPNTFMDILVGGIDFVATAQQRAYRESGISTVERAVITTTAPVAGTTAGAYQIGEYPVTIASPTTGTLDVVVSDVPSDILESVKAEREGNEAFDPATADTTGALQYTVADANGNHSVTLRTQIN